MSYFYEHFDEQPRNELLKLIRAYDYYIQNANDDNRYFNGWRPVCISEFFDIDFQATLEEL